MKRPPTPEALAAECAAWNDQHPIGARVFLKKDSGETIETTTRSAASILGGHSAVIWLDGVSGGYALDRVTDVEDVLLATP